MSPEPNAIDESRAWAAARALASGGEVSGRQALLDAVRRTARIEPSPLARLASWAVVLLLAGGAGAFAINALWFLPVVAIPVGIVLFATSAMLALVPVSAVVGFWVKRARFAAHIRRSAFDAEGRGRALLSELYAQADDAGIERRRFTQRAILYWLAEPPGWTE